jgi:hypothetical protein
MPAVYKENKAMFLFISKVEYRSFFTLHPQMDSDLNIMAWNTVVIISMQ